MQGLITLVLIKKLMRLLTPEGEFDLPDPITKRQCPTISTTVRPLGVKSIPIFPIKSVVTSQL